MFGVIGQKEPLIKRDPTFLSNSEKTFTSRNLSASLNLSGNKRPENRRIGPRPHSAMASYSVDQTESSPTLDDLERTLSTLKSDLKKLNSSLEENYAKSRVYARDANYNESRYIKEFEHETQLNGDTEESDDEDLRNLLQRKDQEAVSHLPANDSQWFRDPKHLTTSMGDFETSRSLGISTRSVSPTNRGTGIFGAEMATKNIDGQFTSTDLASSMETFPVRLTAPHIVGVRSLLPPKYPVKMQNSSTSPSRISSAEVTAVPYFPLKSSASPKHSDTTKPKWIPNSRNANASAKAPPPLKKPRQRSVSLPRRPATALGIYENDRKAPELVTRGRSITRHTTLSSGSYPRQMHPLPSETEIRFLKSADAIDTRRALVDNSPYQQELARLRLTRLRVEEEYLLQLKRESELERIRGPKPKWYAMKGPEFHYECNKNTALHKNKKSWGKILQYRNDLLDSSREFAQTV